MTDPHAPSRTAAADPQGSGRDAVSGDASRDARGGLESDPIFQAERPPEAAAKGTLLLWQFFLFPLLVVAAAVGVFVFFGVLGGSQRTPQETLKALRQGGENEQKQASLQLANQIRAERERVDAEGANAKPPFYVDPAFQAGIRGALLDAVHEKDASDDRRVWLAQALGRVAPPAPSADGAAIASVLLSILYPSEGDPESSPAVRLGAAKGLLFMESTDALPALVRAAEDPHDTEVRATAVNALALLGLPKHGGGKDEPPEVREVLRRALEDPHGGIRANAAAALVLRGDESALPILERSLDRRRLVEMGITDPEWQRNALANAITAAHVSGFPSLEPLVARLTDDANEPDAGIRKLAQEAVRTWRNR